jgi:hypothetical protein
MMSIAASLTSVKKPRFNVDLGEERQTIEGDANWLNNTPTRALFTILVDSSSASGNVKPAHTHKQVLCSQLTTRLSISPVCLKQRL